MDVAVDRLMTLKVKDVMTRKVICVTDNQRLSDAAGLFLEKGISGAPVVDQDGRCVGVLSAIDYVRRAHSTRGAGVTDTAGEFVYGEMSPGVRFVQPEQTLLMAARIMCEKHVHRLPVLDLDGKPVGLITSMDVVAALVNAIDEREALTR
ncbi:MAG: CBS domain-containing protein [Planctomycetaceae bacterium]|nr:CBS domain-containing protein [Planctomycetaceae bacterium]